VREEARAGEFGSEELKDMAYNLPNFFMKLENLELKSYF
jgi:hypothetical protein